MISDFSSIIRLRRKELNMTLTELATKLNTTASTVSKWERGETTTLRRERVMMIAKALDIHPAILFGYSAVDVDTLDTKKQITSNKIPVYSLTNSDFFSVKNISTFITTELENAHFAVLSGFDCQQDKSQGGNDLCLIQRDIEPLNDTLVLAITENGGYIAKFYCNDYCKALLRGTELIQLTNNITIVGKVIEIRKRV